MDISKRGQKKYYEEIFDAAKKQDRHQFRKLFLELHDYDQLKVFQLLYPTNKEKISILLTPKEFAGIFEKMNSEDKRQSVQYLSKEFIHSFFNYLPDDVIVSFFNEAVEYDEENKEKVTHVFGKNYIEEILTYKPRTAGFLMTKNFCKVYYSSFAPLRTPFYPLHHKDYLD